MNTFVNAVDNQTTLTENGMVTFVNTSNALTDLFFDIGASRGKNIIPKFAAALSENQELAIRIALWARDVRGGAGERKLFRDIISYLAITPSVNKNTVYAVLKKAVELGRWDDILVVFEYETMKEYRDVVIMMIDRALMTEQNALCAKWMPRKGPVAIALREGMGLTPKQYRKVLVNLTKVVETQMCAKDWNGINFNHVPSLAMARYKKAFKKNSTEFTKWTEKLASGDESVKVNAGAVYPYDVIKNWYSWGKSEKAVANAQWDALPNYIGDNNVLPVVDVSGSMTCPAGGYNSKSVTTCIDVSLSLGLYCSDKNTGPFKDMFMTFSAKPELLKVKGDIASKLQQMNNYSYSWGMNTDVNAAMRKILDVAKKGNVKQDDMPKVLLIMSDMQFDQCADFTAHEMIKNEYEKAGYQMPVVVFWNLNASGNSPVKFHTSGAALISGFSPSIMKSVLSCDLSAMTPYGVMMNTIMNDKYSY